jgi:hypothetical protein
MISIKNNLRWLYRERRAFIKLNTNELKEKNTDLLNFPLQNRYLQIDLLSHDIRGSFLRDIPERRQVHP